MSEKFPVSAPIEKKPELQEVKDEELAQYFLQESKERLMDVEVSVAKKIAQLELVKSWFPDEADVEVNDELMAYHTLMNKWMAELDELESLRLSLKDDTQKLERIVARDMD